MYKAPLARYTGSHVRELTITIQMSIVYFDHIGKGGHLGEGTVILSSLTTACQYLIDGMARDNVVFDTGPAKHLHTSPDITTIYQAMKNLGEDPCIQVTITLLHLLLLTTTMSTELSEFVFNIGPTKRKKNIYTLEQVYYQSPQENMLLFDSIINSPWISQKLIILFLNNFAVFEKRISVLLLSVHFPNNDDSDTNIHPAASFFDQQYHRRLNRTPELSMRETLESVHDIMFQSIKYMSEGQWPNDKKILITHHEVLGMSRLVEFLY
ncbi:uncharacterized protein BO88DRAFT_430437 [Aspergillus vadensis CBS 113365]|uniref:Uncharacterized protein n=1 Tax=Aspergillus vadensis (strain CBS 113365 / IMI 142717 / IBT 24658) TaxID=1448311 RepID=A0A319ASZ4_ASPVC|nr:hypothetical protein BO88DRAFT_430437 [Aspergillus vadensis CBS 113365]PYH63409.1 hypothetical protein BO88DRAFT_430437 [Aspergillus vadensis CBS 113365]